MVESAVDERQRRKLLRRDPELARLVDRVADASHGAAVVDELIAWALARDTDRRSLADEALERYRELNLLYDLAERSASLEPEQIMSAASVEVARVCRGAITVPLLVEEDEEHLRAIDSSAYPVRVAFGEGIVGSIAAADGGEIVNDPASDPRATFIERDFGPIMLAPLRAGDRRLGVLLASRRQGPDFTAGEHRMLSAVAVLTAPGLDAALTHVQALARARAREQELERQLETLRTEVEATKREERVREITGTEYFQMLRRQADVMRHALKSGKGGTET